MTKLSISTITMTGSTAVTDSRAFSCILSFNVFLCIRNSLTNPFPANEIPLALYSAVCWFPKICLPYLITDHSILPEFFQLFHTISISHLIYQIHIRIVQCHYSFR